jgi:hypothetical protein
MRKTILAAAITAFAATAAIAGGVALHTGQKQMVPLMGGGYGLNCEYLYLGQRFWRTFRETTCPYEVPVN